MTCFLFTGSTAAIALGIVGTTCVCAADGQFEINQACALNTGCFAGDDPGFPVSITQPGSYRLTSNLDLSDQDPRLDGIAVRSHGVTIDLAGFQISGPASCSGSGATLSCAPRDASGGWGVLFWAKADGSAVKNGTVRGMVNSGIGSEAIGTRVEHITAVRNAIDGIGVHEGALIVNCVAIENGSDGIDTDAGSVVDGVTAMGNGKDGIEVDGPGAVVTRSNARGNGEKGFNLPVDTTFGKNRSRDNAQEDRCGGGICTEKKRFYLTESPVQANAALTACTPGFHMASLWEIHDITARDYDYALGVKLPSYDTGLGPPMHPGWIRNGNVPVPAQLAGSTNCDLWTASAGSFGTVVRLDNRMTGAAMTASPWKASAEDCGTSNRVWCAED